MRRGLSAPTTAVGLLAIVAGAAGIITGSAGVSRAQQNFSLEIDTGPIGNTADALGPTETCVAVGAGESFVVDIVAKDAPPLSGVEISLNYNPQVLRITNVQANPGLFLGKNPGANVISLSGPVPDEDGSYRPAAFDFGDSLPGGNGTVFRVVLETKAAGISPLQIPADDPSTFFDEGPVIPDPNSPPFGQPGLTPLLAGGEVRVGEACPAGAASPPAPARPGELGVGAQPTPEVTPGPGEAPTPSPTERTPVTTATPTPGGGEGGEDDSETGSGGTSSGDDGSDLTDMPWLALWIALGALAIGGSGGALLRLLARRMR